MNLVLVGYRGTGKSTIGRLLAVELGLNYVGMDEEIVRRAGVGIPEIVRTHSWDYFRDLESAVVADYAERDSQLLDTGGGVVIRSGNVALLRKQGIVFWLVASVEDIVARISSSTDRPSLTGGKSFLEEVEEVLEARRSLYQSAADFVVDTSLLPPEQAAAEIAGRFRTAAGLKVE